MSAFSPSALRHRVSLEALAREADGGGGFTDSWTELAELWAAITPTDGSESVEADRLAGTVTHEIVLRYRVGVTPSMRFRVGTRVFQILSAIDWGERGVWLRCLCEEREL
jgi:SPP1 family predicted phage head-tail adaptor